jgi:ribosomal protein S18 acetylase RimI-like enzyme
VAVPVFPPARAVARRPGPPGPPGGRRPAGGNLPDVSVDVEVVREANDEVTAAMRHLLPQLSTSAAEPDQAAVQRIVGSEATTLLAAKLDGQIVGFLALAMFPIPTGFRAWIEDVIVDEAARGRGIGEVLTKKALDLAEMAGARTVDLTSRPSREAAGRLYERVGFAPRSTRIYRYTFGQTA